MGQAPRRFEGIGTSTDDQWSASPSSVRCRAYNAAQTLERTIAEVPPGVVEGFLLVDDASRDGDQSRRRRAVWAIPYVGARAEPRITAGNQKTC
jgi:hypothetical protein